jgi:soluble P-type ATPase
MLAVDIPGYGTLRIEHLVLDYNGTVAVDGTLLPGVKRRLRKLADDVRVHVVTADTFGKASSELRGLRSELKIIGGQSQDRAKAAYVQRLGPQRALRRQRSWRRMS